MSKDYEIFYKRIYELEMKKDKDYSTQNLIYLLKYQDEHFITIIKDEDNNTTPPKTGTTEG